MNTSTTTHADSGLASSFKVGRSNRRRKAEFVIFMSVPVLATGYARADLINSAVLEDTPTLHRAVVDYTFPLIVSSAEEFTENWSWRLFEDDFDGDSFIDDFFIEAFHRVGPHGEEVPNGPLGGFLIDVPNPGIPANGTYTDFLLHGVHLDSLEVRFDPIGQNVSAVTIELRHNIPEPASVALLLAGGLLLVRRRRTPKRTDRKRESA